MGHFLVEPEVAGGLGERTVIDRSVHPPVVTRLHYRFDGWLGDVLVESFPAFIVTQEARDRLARIAATGVAFGIVEVTVSPAFERLHPGRVLPAFCRLEPRGEAGRADFGVARDGRLVVSRRALDVLAPLGLSHAIIAAFPVRASGRS